MQSQDDKTSGDRGGTLKAPLGLAFERALEGLIEDGQRKQELGNPILSGAVVRVWK